MCTPNKTSFHVNGFWFHLTFSSGNIAKDQHGMDWYRQGNKLVSAGGSFVYELPKTKHAASNKDFFLEQREAWASYFVNRAYSLK